MDIPDEIEGNDQEARLRAANILMKAIDAALEENNVQTQFRIPMSIGYVADLMGAMIKTAPVNNAQARVGLLYSILSRITAVALFDPADEEENEHGTTH